MIESARALALFGTATLLALCSFPGCCARQTTGQSGLSIETAEIVGARGGVADDGADEDGIADHATHAGSSVRVDGSVRFSDDPPASASVAALQAIGFEFQLDDEGLPVCLGAICSGSFPLAARSQMEAVVGVVRVERSDQRRPIAPALPPAGSEASPEAQNPPQTTPPQTTPPSNSAPTETE